MALAGDYCFILSQMTDSINSDALEERAMGYKLKNTSNAVGDVMSVAINVLVKDN